MIRRLELDLFRVVRVVTKKSSVKFVLGGSFGALALMNIPAADCAGKGSETPGASASYFGFFSNSNSGKGPDSGDDGRKSDPVADLIEQYMPALHKLGFGGLMGICTGVAMKRIGNGAAAAIGMSFVGLQILSYLGYITIDYKKVTQDASTLLDADGDGQLTHNDAVVLWNKVKDVLSYHLPSASGFSAGLALGLYFGN